MPFALSDKQRLMLELIADAPVPAIPKLEPITAVLLATSLIALTDETKWKVTHLGKAMLERQHFLLH